MLRTRTSGPGRTSPATGIDRYVQLLTKSHVWLLAPTWIAINAALGLYTSQTLFQLINSSRTRGSPTSCWSAGSARTA